MKPNKKIMISFAFLTPIVLSTPILLASCSYIPLVSDKTPDSGSGESDKTPDSGSGDVQKPDSTTQNDLNNLATWSALKANDVYISNNKPAYLFKSGTKKDVFDFTKASESIQKLVTNSIYAGNVLDVKTKSASNAISSDFEKVVSSDSKKSTFIKKDFDLTNQVNFNLISQFIANQKFTNMYTKKNSEIEGDTYLGNTLWFTSQNFNAIKKLLACDVYVSLSEIGSKAEKIKYNITFSFTIKNQSTWPKKNNNYPVKFELEFETRNFISIYSEHDQNRTTKKPYYFATSSDSVNYNAIEFDAGELSKKSIKTVSESLKHEDVINSFAISGQKAGHYPSTNILTLLDNHVDSKKVTKAFSNIQVQKLVNYNKENLEHFNIPTNKSSLPYILSDVSSSNGVDKPVYKDKDVYIKRIDLWQNEIKFKIRHTKKDYKWFWGNWDEITNPYTGDYNNAQYNDFEIWIKMTIKD